MTDLMSAEEFRRLVKVTGTTTEVVAAYAAALARVAEAGKQIDVLVESGKLMGARVAELEALVRHWEWANAEQDQREDALAAELAELRAAFVRVAPWMIGSTGHEKVCADAREGCDNENHRVFRLVHHLAAQPQGERGKVWIELLQYAKKATANHPYDEDFTCHLCMVRQAVDRLAAIDGAQA